MAKKRDRLTVDPAIGVMDLQRVLMKHMELQPEKDLWALLKHPTGGAWSWKTAVSVKWLAQAKNLLIDFCGVAPNAVLPSKKLRIAIHRLVTDSNRKVNKTSYHTDDFADQLDQRIRVLLAQARALKKQEDYTTAMKKATQQEKDAVDEILSHIRYGMDAMGTMDAQVTEEPEAASSSSSLALVAVSGAGELQPDLVFKRILEKKDSSPLKPAKPQKVARTTASSSSGHGFLMMGNIVSSSESEVLEEPKAAVEASSQRRAAKKFAGEARKQTVDARAIAGHGMDADDLLIMEASLTGQVKAENKGLKKKPAAKVSEPAVGQAKLKCSFKHRKTSSVYAKERKLRLKLGNSPETAKRMARSAMQDVAAKIDAGLLKED